MSAIKPNDNLGKGSPEDIPIDIKNLSPEMVQEIRGMVKEFDDMLTPFEKKVREENNQRTLLREKQMREAVEKAANNEEFQIPVKTGQKYRFIGYDSDQYEDLNEIGTKADHIPRKERGGSEYTKLEITVYKKMIKYSLEGIPDEVVNKLPKHQLYWFYRIMKEKNDNPLPFVQKE